MDEILRQRTLTAVGRWSAGSATAVAKRALVSGVGFGAVTGGIAGLCIGVAVYLPTSPVAMVEGGIFGAALGLPLSVVLFAACLSLKRVHR